MVNDPTLGETYCVKTSVNVADAVPMLNVKSVAIPVAKPESLTTVTV